MRKALLLVLIVALWPSHKAQNWEWNKVEEQHTSAFALCKDASNNVYSYRPLSDGSSLSNSTVKKFDSQGQLLWTLTLPGAMKLKSIAAAEDGSVYMGGTCWGYFVYNGTSYNGKGKTDIWVARYNADNSLAWMKVIGSREDDFLGEICTSGNDVVITGMAGDTLDLMGSVVPKERSKDFFLARASAAASAQAVKLSAPDSVYEMYPEAAGMECAGDKSGNIYVRAVFSGRGLHRVDTFHVGFQSDNTTYDSHVLMKFSPQLQLQYVRPLVVCMSDANCEVFYDLSVNAGGDAYLVKFNSYGQSGNDVMRSTVIRYGQAGVPTTSFEPRPDRKNHVKDIDIDHCGNVYFTGYCRNYINSPVVTITMFNGQLAPDLEQAWLRCDSTTDFNLSGEALAVVSPNKVFVAGSFADTLTLASTMVSTSQYNGFYAGLKNPDLLSCDVSAGVVGGLEERRPVVYPNPCADALLLRNEAGDSELFMYSPDGSLLMHRSLLPGNISIDTGNFPEGIYLLRVTGSLGARTAKVVVAR